MLGYHSEEGKFWACCHQWLIELRFSGSPAGRGCLAPMSQGWGEVSFPLTLHSTWHWMGVSLLEAHKEVLRELRTGSMGKRCVRVLFAGAAPEHRS